MLHGDSGCGWMSPDRQGRAGLTRNPWAAVSRLTADGYAVGVSLDERRSDRRVRDPLCEHPRTTA